VGVTWVGSFSDGDATKMGTMPDDCKAAVMKRCTEKGTVKGSMVDSGGWLWAKMNSTAAANRVVSRLNGTVICGGLYKMQARITEESNWPSGGTAWSQMVSQPRNDAWHNRDSWQIGKDGKREKGGKRHKQMWKKGGGEKMGWPAPY
jgi:hypothetical protein